MVTTRELLSGPVDLSSAKGRSANVLHALSYPQQKKAFFKQVQDKQAALAAAAAHHLGIKESQVTITPQEYWNNGSFNLVVPFRTEVDGRLRATVPEYAILRFPLPYRVGESTRSGSVDEKVNCEAATYAWLQENCPTVPIPKLYGFGLSTNRRFTHCDFVSWWEQWIYRLKHRLLAVFGQQRPSRYICRNSNSPALLDLSYMVIEYVTEGSMLSESWDANHSNPQLQENLQRSLARTMLSLASIHLPRIGSFRLNNKGYLVLENRPLSVQWTIHQNEGLPLELESTTTFSSVKEYVLFHLATFENRLLHQPNSVVDKNDAYWQISSLAGAKLVLPQLFRKELDSGPFALCLTDLHRSNIFVDDDWNITSIIDLEFACSLPVEFAQPPYWLSGGLIEDVKPDEFGPKHARFVDLLASEEESLCTRASYGERLSVTMRKGWANGTFWGALAIRNPIGFTTVFWERILPQYFSFTSDELSGKIDYTFFARLWRRGVCDIIEQKLRDKTEYDGKLAAAFLEPPPASDSNPSSNCCSAGPEAA